MSTQCNQSTLCSVAAGHDSEIDLGTGRDEGYLPKSQCRKQIDHFDGCEEWAVPCTAVWADAERMGEME